MLKTIISILRYTAIIPAILFAACSDEINPQYDFTASGCDVTLTVQSEIPQLEVKSRGNLGSEQLNTVQSLWVRTYSAVTKEATSEWVPFSPGITNNDTAYPISLATKSGLSYIVAVANVENPGVTSSDPDNERPLSELLANADTWDQFLAIAARTPSTNSDVNKAPWPITMAGCYTTVPVGDPKTHPKLSEWGSDINFEPVFIPASDDGSVTLEAGAIHLRRLVSHITFNIITENDSITVTPISYSVVNIPKSTWLYERGADRQENFGDACTQDNADQYYTTENYTGQYFTDNGDGTTSFDFWQGENKHNALPDAGCDSYSKREREHKVDGANTGLYTSLTGNSWTPNNMASYVTITCTIDYKDSFKVDADGSKNPAGTEINRTGNVVYTVHLGYLDEIAADFNSYRNVNYTYKLTINGINDIRLEAYGDEKYPGAEGIVSDVEHQTLYIDAHYSAFNIELSWEELTNVTSDGEGFGYIITAMDNTTEYTFQNGDDVPADREKYVDWIELRPTTAGVLAEYKPRTGDHADGRTFTLREAAEVRSWPDGKNDKRISSDGVYTVFINEYTYETDPNEDTHNWTRYVNLSPRRFYVRVTKKISADGMSQYVRSKYAVSQSSIQTYYSRTNLTPAQGDIQYGTAIGLERTNETEGLNMRISYSGTSQSNGRWNVWQWIQSKSKDKLWSDFIDTTTPQYIPAVAGTNAQNGAEIKAHTAPMPKLANFGDKFTTSGTDPQPNSTDASYYFEGINGCMNRNRDNNGNGVIDPDELRWYVPATGKYLRLILGSNSLPNPIFNFNSVSQLPNTNNGDNTRYLYYSSNNDVIWAMEGLSVSNYNYGYARPPWQIRCIRNLGSNMSNITDSEKVVAAYQHDATNKIVRMSYYDDESIRTETLSGNGDAEGQMPVHMTNSPYNMPYKAFQYSSQTVDNISGSWDAVALNTNITTTINNNPCSSLNTETVKNWRVPNQKELAILRNLGVIDISAYQYITSCTVSYFNMNGAGNSYTKGNNKFLGARSTGATQIPADGQGVVIRCVRDYIE